jgi:hypothetical protein
MFSILRQGLSVRAVCTPLFSIAVLAAHFAVLPRFILIA